MRLAWTTSFCCYFGEERGGEREARGGKEKKKRDKRVRNDERRGSRKFGSRLADADDALEQARFFHFPFIAHLDRVEALLLEVRLLRAGDDDQVAAARGDSAVEDLSRKRARGGNRKKK